MGASAIQFLNDQVGYAVFSGTAHVYFKTTDGGTNWVNTPGMLGSNYCMHFMNEQEGWVGSAGKVWHTIDGGINWTSAFVGGGAAIHGVHFYSPLIGFCVSESNYVFKSFDGGITWSPIVDTYITMPVSLRSHFTDNYCYLGCTGGDIYRCELGCGAFTAGNITGDNQWCENQAGQLVVPQISGAQSYVWILPPGWTGATNNPLIQPIASDQSGLVTVTITNACGLQSSTSYNVTVTPQVASPGAITGATSICNGVNNVYSVPIDDAATSYLWQTTSGIVSTSNDNELTITSATQGGTIYLHTSNSCGVSDTVSLSISLVPPPEVSFQLPDSICFQNVLLLSSGMPSGGTYSGIGVNNNLFDPITLVGESTEITYTYSSSEGCTNTATDSIYVFETLNTAANLNGDCHVNVEDLQMLIQSFGCINNCSIGDLDGDGIVGVQDLMLLMGAFTE